MQIIKFRRGEIGGATGGLIAAVVAIFLTLILVANLYPTSLGTIANSTTGNAMKNVDSGTKQLYLLIGLLAVVATVIVILKTTGIV